MGVGLRGVGQLADHHSEGPGYAARHQQREDHQDHEAGGGGDADRHIERLEVAGGGLVRALGLGFNGRTDGGHRIFHLMEGILHGAEPRLGGGEVLGRKRDGFAGDLEIALEGTGDGLEFGVTFGPQVAVGIGFHFRAEDLGVLIMVLLRLGQLGRILGAGGQHGGNGVAAQGVMHHVGGLLGLQGDGEFEHAGVVRADHGELLEDAGENSAKDDDRGQGDAEDFVADG